MSQTATAREPAAPVVVHDAEDLPRLPTAGAGAEEDWKEHTHRFYRYGPTSQAEVRSAEGAGFEWEGSVPAALLPMREARPGLPAVLMPGSPGEATRVLGLDALLEESLQTLRSSGTTARVLGEILPRLLRRISRRVRDESRALPFREIAGEEAESLLSDLDLSGDSGAGLAEDTERLLALFHLQWRIFGPSVDVRLLAVETIRRSREQARHQILEEARFLAEHVDDLLRIDDAKGSSKGLDRGLETGLGEAGLKHIDFEALARLHPDRRARRLEEQRRRRLERVSKVLSQWLGEDAQSPLRVYIFGREDDLSGMGSLPDSGVVVKAGQRPLQAATSFFPETAAPVVELARALRVARLELSGSYRPEIHDLAIDTLDWQALKQTEMALIPAVLALSNGPQLLELDMGDLCSLAWSGRPVIVLSTGPAPDPEELRDLSRHQPALGAMTMALRHAWVMQTSACRPAHLAAGLLDCDPRFPGMILMAQSPRPLNAEAAVAGRAHPIFVFRPGVGEGEIDLLANPAPMEGWPTATLEVLGRKGPEEMKVSLTFAEAAFFLPEGKEHLLPIPPEAWCEEQVPLAEWISHPSRDKPGGPLPFIWLLGADGYLWRAVVSRALALACADRLRDYQLLQEMAGLSGAHLERARNQAREEALAEMEQERARLIAEKEKAVEDAAAQAAREAMSGLASALLSDGSFELTASEVKAPPAPTARPHVQEEEEPEAPAAQPKEEEEEEEALLLDPWIDTPCCTSCNDCFKINDLLFKYDENKQALLGDLSKGTYADLVRAAEVCPAKCIHPGKPKPDDPTATPEMIQRGAKL